MILSRMDRSLLLVLLGFAAVCVSALPQDPQSLAHLNAFVNAASLQDGRSDSFAEPLVTSASETRFRFGKSNGGSTSDRRFFIPGLDRRERRPTGLLSGASSGIGAPPQTTKSPTTTPPSKPKPVVPTHDNKFSDDYYNSDDEYYYDYYYDYYDTNSTGEGQLGPLGALDPPSLPSTIGPAKTPTSSRPFRFDLKNKLNERPSLISSRATTLPPRSSSRAHSTRPSLADILRKRVQDAQESQPNTPINNDLTGQNREPRILEESHTEKEEMQVHVTTNTESSRVISSIKSSQSINVSQDRSSTTPKQLFADETTALPSSTSEDTELSTTSHPETTSKRSLADIFETVNSESYLTGNVNSAEKIIEDLQTTTTTTKVAPAIEIEFDSSNFFESLLPKKNETKTGSIPTTTEKIELGTNEPSPTTTTLTPISTAATTAELSDETIFDLFAAVKSGNVSSFVPPGYESVEVPQESTTKKANIQLIDDVSAFLPPGYKAPENESAKPLIKTVNVSDFLPPGFKPPANAEASVVETVDVSAFLPPGYKPQGPDTEASTKKIEIEIVDMSSFLPQGFNAPDHEEKDSKSAKPQGPPVEPVIKTVDVSDLLPPGYTVTKGEEAVSSTTTEATTTTRKPLKDLKFPNNLDRPAFLVTTTSTTTEKPTTSGLPPVKPIIRNVTTTTTTTTTTSTTSRPTTPGMCGSKCRLFATIKITNGTQWVTELESRDTIEWQQLANTIDIELDQLYRSSPLAPWYEGVEIDGFKKGSIIVDYFIQFNEIKENIGTTDLKEVLNRATASGEENRLGSLTLDSRATDFVVMQEKRAGIIDKDSDYLIPQWLIAVIVIGLASLLFILIFGITVLVNRSRVNKRHSVPLTEDMLNELNQTHMGGYGHGNQAHMGGYNHGHPNMVGGLDNYAMDAGLYDMDAVWNDKKMDKRMIKPPSSHGKGYNPDYNINIYDSWRSDWSGPYGSSATYAKRPRINTEF